MYQIISTNSGIKLGVTESPFYICLSKNGCFVPATADTATGISLNGSVYNLVGHSEIENADTVLVVKEDAGNYILLQDEEITQTQEAIVELYELLIGVGDET